MKEVPGAVAEWLEPAPPVLRFESTPVLGDIYATGLPPVVVAGPVTNMGCMVGTTVVMGSREGTHMDLLLGPRSACDPIMPYHAMGLPHIVVAGQVSDN